MNIHDEKIDSNRPDIDWLEEIPGSVTVCDEHGIIVYMNAMSRQTFENGDSLVGKNLLDCHPEPARSKLEDLLSHPRSNTYTVEKNGKKKLIHQVPWFNKGAFAGLVEFSFEIPLELPHFIRQTKTQ